MHFFYFLPAGLPAGVCVWQKMYAYKHMHLCCRHSAGSFFVYTLSYAYRFKFCICMAVNNAIEKHMRIENSVKGVINDAKELKFQDDVKEVQKMMKGFVKDGDPGIDELLNKTDKYGADVIAQAYVNVAKEIGKEDVWQMTQIDEAFNFEHPVFEREFDFIRSRDPEADAALDFLDMEMGRER